MGKLTSIAWADSTANGQMGCAGCELASRSGSGTCYAEVLTDGMQRGGRNGWPNNFYTPKTFPQRYDQLLRWEDLTGTKRPGKPWLDGLPRHIFHNDMGDVATPGLSLDWWHPWAERFAAMPALHIFLTKWPSRLQRSFDLLGCVPGNFIVGTSITGPKSYQRARALLRIKARRWLSIEPDIEGVTIEPFLADPGDGLPPFEWAVVGGESGKGAREYKLEWAERTLDGLRAAGVRRFMKQIGSRPTLDDRPFRCEDRKGERMDEWPAALQVREMPEAPR